MLHPLHNSTLLAAVALRNSTPSRSCGFTRCCARRRRHRERCQACRVQMAPPRVKMTSFLSPLFCILWAASPAQTACPPLISALARAGSGSRTANTTLVFAVPWQSEYCLTPSSLARCGTWTSHASTHSL